MKRRSTALLLSALLLLAACGSRLSDEQRAALATTGGGAEQGVLGSGTDFAAGDSSSTTVADDATATTAAGGGGGGGGEAAGGGGGGGEAEEAGGGVFVGGSTCGGGGASDVGVSETEIRIGNVGTISGPIPGFGQTGVNAVKAYANYVNANGGVCGRKLVVVGADDRLQSGTNKSETDKLKESVLGFVGGVTVVDDGAAQSIEGTNVALTGLAISDPMIRSANNFSVSPIDLADGGNGAAPYFRYMKEHRGASRAAIIWPAQAQAKARIDGYRKDFERAGIELVLQTEVAVTETNYADDAANIESAKADLVVTNLEISGMARLAKALEQNGYFPKNPAYGAQAYGRNFLAQAGSAAEPTVLGLSYSILEDAPSVPAVNELVTWYERTNPGADIDFFAIMSWAATDLYVDALRSVEGPPTRDKVLAALQATTEFDADGVLAPVNPAQKKGSGCFMIAEVNGGKWVRAHPAEGFDCSYR